MKLYVHEKRIRVCREAGEGLLALLENKTM